MRVRSGSLLFLIVVLPACDKKADERVEAPNDGQTLADPPPDLSQNPHAFNTLMPPDLALVPQEKGDDSARGHGSPRPALSVPEDAKARDLYEQAVAALRDGRIPEAIEMLDKCVAQNPNSGSCHRALGIAHARSGNGPEAARAYRRYLEVAPTSRDASQVQKLLDDYERAKPLSDPEP